jgi:uncharacterized protein (TIGR02246 family)
MPEESTTPDLQALAQRVVDATNARDFDAVMSFYAPDAVLDAEGIGLHQGRPAIRGLYEGWWGAYEDHQQEAEEIRDLGSGVIVLVVHQRARLPGATGLLRGRYAAVATWANGLIEKQTNYLDIDAAHAAAERLAESRE